MNAAQMRETSSRVPGADDEDDGQGTNPAGLDGQREQANPTAVFRSAARSASPINVKLSPQHETSKNGKLVKDDENHGWEGRFRSLLYDRTEERELLIQAYRRNAARRRDDISLSTDGSTGATRRDEVRSEMILISGPCGTGKTSLARSLRQTVEEDKGYFCLGKFDSLECSEPFRGWRSAFTSLAKKLMSRGEDARKKFRRKVSNALGNELCVLADLVPAMREVMGKDIGENVPHASGNALRRFVYVVKAFLSAISSNELPVVIVLDDIQYADKCSWYLLENLLSCEGLVVCGTCSSQVAPDSPLSSNLRRMESQFGEGLICNISLGNLEGGAALKFILAETFHSSQEQCRDLAEIILRQTAGSMPHTLEMVRWLVRKRLLIQIDGQWSWDDAEIEQAINQSQIDDYISERLGNLPIEAKQIIETASCLGSIMKQSLLNVVLTGDQQQFISHVLEEGVLIAHDEEYRFLSDGERKAAYSLIPESDREGFHLMLARKLRETIGQNINDNIFVTMGQFKAGRGSISDDEERHDIATLCLAAGMRAASRSAFTAASEYFLFGVSLLNTERKWKEDNDLSLAFYNALAEIAVITSKFDVVDKLLEEVLSVNPDRPDDKLQAYSTKIYSLSIRDRHQEAISTGVQALKTLGVTFPQNNTFQLMSELRKVEKRLRGKSDEMILRLPMMTDYRTRMAMQLMNALTLDCMFSRPLLAAFIIFKMVKLTLKHGLCEHASTAFATYGMILVSTKRAIDEGCRRGKLGLKLLSYFGSDAYLPRVYCAVYSSLHVFHKPLSSTIAPLEHAHQVALLTGDLEFAGLSANIVCLTKAWSGVPLPLVEKEIEHHIGWMKAQQQDSSMTFAEPILNFVKVLQGRKSCRLNLSALDKMLAHAQQSGNKLNMIVALDQKLIICYLFGKSHDAMEAIADLPIGLVDDFFLQATIAFHGMVLLALASETAPWSKRRWYIRQCRGLIKKLQRVSKKAPANYSCMVFLLQGELASVLRQNDKANEKLSCAISMASSSGFSLLHALSLERLGWHSYRRFSDEEFARSNFAKACEVYDAWGATAKAEHLRQETKFLQQTANIIAPMDM